MLTAVNESRHKYSSVNLKCAKKTNTRQASEDLKGVICEYADLIIADIWWSVVHYITKSMHFDTFSQIRPWTKCVRLNRIGADSIIDVDLQP